MNEATIKIITAELRDKLVGQKFGKIFVLGRSRFAIDFRGDDGAYLLISANPSQPRLFLIKRQIKDLNKESGTPNNFVSVLRKVLTHAVLCKVEKLDGERIVLFLFEARDEAGLDISYRLVVQLTGRSSNVFLVDSNSVIVDSLRNTSGPGQSKGQKYEQPPPSDQQNQDIQAAFDPTGFNSLSEALDTHYKTQDDARAFRQKADSALAVVRQDLKKRRRLAKKLLADLKGHGEPGKWKRLGDLVNANIATAVRHEDIVTLIDYFDENLPEIELEIDRHTSLTDAADKYFKKYTKARNAKIEIEKRLIEVDAEIKTLEARLGKIESAAASNDPDQLLPYLPAPKSTKKVNKSSGKQNVSKYAREYISSDGYSILVGKRSKDNDHLTFRIARSLDVWLHAADYPGSHVVIRRKGREEIPQSTVVEAAQLAAFYSKAKNEGKAAVRYAERKFVNKQKGAAPGLVSLASFKTILVKPGVPSFEN
jgi:predicted ribosome quality control (RQC) complex YloA/Tae2 family protein